MSIWSPVGVVRVRDSPGRHVSNVAPGAESAAHTLNSAGRSGPVRPVLHPHVPPGGRVAVLPGHTDRPGRGRVLALAPAGVTCHQVRSGWANDSGSDVGVAVPLAAAVRRDLLQEGPREELGRGDLVIDDAGGDRQRPHLVAPPGLCSGVREVIGEQLPADADLLPVVAEPEDHQLAGAQVQLGRAGHPGRVGGRLERPLHVVRRPAATRAE